MEVPRVNWADMGGLGSLRQELIESIEWPINNPEKFQRMGIRPPREFLLYGPPGTGKTMIAQAVANETSAKLHKASGARRCSPSGWASQRRR